MIKAVVQSIPTYSISVFKLSVGLCKYIEAMIHKFWWGNGESKKIHWINWRSLCSSILGHMWNLLEHMLCNIG